MEQLIKKSDLISEIENIKALEFYEGTARDDYACMALDMLKDAIETIQQVEEHHAGSVWHDAQQPPEMHRKYLARYSDGRVNGSWERYGDGSIPWKDVIKEHRLTHWCYIDDLLKL